MDNQHKMIAGYRDLAEHEIKTINALKAIEEDLSQLLTSIGTGIDGPAGGRWLAMARSYLEIGLMFAIKAIALPNGGLGNPERDTEQQLDAALGASDGEEVGREERQEAAYVEAFEAAQRADPRPEPEPLAGRYEERLREAFALTRDGRPKLTEEQIAYERDAIGHDPYAKPPLGGLTVEQWQALQAERRHDAEQAAQKAAGTYEAPRDPLIDHDAVAQEAYIAAEHEAMMQAEFDEAVAASAAEAEPALLPDVEPAPFADESHVQLDAEQEREARLAEEEMNRPRSREEYRQLATPEPKPEVEPLKFYEAFPSPEAKAEYERQVAENRPKAKPPGEPNATFGSSGARFVPTTDIQKAGAGPDVPTTSPQKDDRARFVPTPHNPEDDPMSAEGRPPIGETSPITSDRQSRLHPKSDRDLP